MYFHFIIIICRVNKKWRSLLNNSDFLWTHVKVRCNKKQKTKFRSTLVKFMKGRFTSSLVHLDISLMNLAGMRLLDKNCPNLTSLVLTVENGKIDLKNVPNKQNLKSLEIKTSEGGGAPKEWWKSLTRENFPNVDTLGLDIERLHIKFLDNLCADFVKLEKLLKDSIATFTGLRHLKLSLDWGMYRGSREWGMNMLQHLQPVVPYLESFHVDYSKYMYDSYSQPLPDDMYTYIVNCEMKDLRKLKLPLKHKPDENTLFLQQLSDLPQLETLYFLSDVTMQCLKAALPLFTNLKDLHVVNVDKKFETEKHRLSKTAKEELWKTVVDEVKTFCPDLQPHLIDHPFRTVRWHKGCQFRSLRRECDYHFKPGEK